MHGDGMAGARFFTIAGDDVFEHQAAGGCNLIHVAYLLKNIC
jgi:hypothetical protein